MTGPAADLLVRTRSSGTLCVPRNLRSLTAWVLLEQEDWFEDEISFLPRLVPAGGMAVDIGANYGAYTLALARAAGPRGQVWSFEPAAETARRLGTAIARNGAENVRLLRTALSNREGTARLGHAGGHAEMLALAPVTAGSAGEEVSVATLDKIARDNSWTAIDVLKLDAEGEEANILDSGAETLRRHAPVLMFERKHGPTVNAAAIVRVAALGFGIYRLAPGLGLLAPCEPERCDVFTLNLFACSPDRAARLQAAGLLARAPSAAPEPDAAAGAAVLASLPCRAGLPARDGPATPDHRAHLEAISLFAAAGAAGAAPDVRLAALEACVAALRELHEARPSPARAMSLARAAAALGERALAASALEPFASALWRGARLPGPDEPFLPPSPRFDALDPGVDAALWTALAILETHERLRVFSSYYTGGEALAWLHRFAPSPLFSPELERRRQLLSLRAGLQAAPQATPPVARERPDNLNPRQWRPDGGISPT